MPIKRNYDIPNLVRELAENRISPHEILREALSNAKDHRAEHVWIKTSKDNRNEVSMILIDDGEGMNDERLEAFWGVGASQKDSQSSIGYKGHGTKLYFDCRRISVATRHSTDLDWRLSSLDLPLESTDDLIEDVPLDASHPLRAELETIGLHTGCGTAIWLENLRGEDKAELLDRQKIESFCDWFTVIGDVRSGLFHHRIDFHRAIAADDDMLASLRLEDAELRPIDVRLCVNGERAYSSIGLGPGKKNREFLDPWKDDRQEFHDRPGLLAFGHRFADVHEAKHGSGTRVRDDMSALCLTDPATWTTSEGISIVARVEGHRRQRITYREARWSGKSGLYGFQQQFGLWLCRDFIPVTQRNDLLRHALERATTRKLRFELSSLRNWKVFVNDQLFKPTANRNDIANHAAREQKITDALVDVLKVALADKPFRDWVERLQTAALERSRNREIKQIQDRLGAVKEWLSTGDDGIDLSDVRGVPRLDPDYSLRFRVPRSEQELFYVYGLLSGRHEMPIHIIDYDASEGVDAIATLRVPALCPTARGQIRVELKQEVRAGFPIHHFFDAIDVILCWNVEKIGDIYEETSANQGKLQRRRSPVLTPALDTHEIIYASDDGSRTIPVLQLSTLFDVAGSSERRRR